MIMLIDHAADLVNGLVLLPKWHVTAESYQHRYSGSLKLTVTVDHPDTDPSNIVDGRYTGEFGIITTWAVRVDDIADDDRTTLALRVLYVLERVFNHEIREALRWGDNLHAALHPHVWETMEDYANLTGGNPFDDVLYGRA